MVFQNNLLAGASGVTEAIEEGWNFMATEEGRHLFKDMTDEDYEQPDNMFEEK